jgi:hypothetical protein
VTQRPGFYPCGEVWLDRGILAFLHWKEIPVEGTFFVVTG